MRTCYLHIGAPKAGSTTIQGFLGDYRAPLKALGVDAADFGYGEVVTGAVALSGALKIERDAARPKTPSWRWLDKHIAKTSDHICISREGICNHLDDDGARAFVKEFFLRRGVRLKLIAYVRDHVSYLNAAYAQQAKKFRIDVTFDDWLVGAIGGGRYSYLGRFKPLLNDPAVDLSVASLHQLGPDGLLDDFSAKIGCAGFDVSGFDAGPHRNATPGPKAVAAALMIAAELKKRGIDPDFDQSLHRRFRLAVEARDWNEKPYYGLDDRQTRRILDHFAIGDEKFSQAALGIPWAEAAPVTPRPRNVFDPASAPEREAREVEELVREILATAQKPARGWRRLFTRVEPVDLD